jgi:hypothetical protein
MPHASGRERTAVVSEHHTRDTPADHLREEFERLQNLFGAQPAIVQRYMEQQGAQLANALFSPPTQLRFSLPDRIVLEIPHQDSTPGAVPAKSREQSLGRPIFDPLTKTNVRVRLRAALIELEGSVDPAIAASASLIRYATAVHLVHSMLPSGRTVVYRSDEDDEIPSIPVSAEGELESAITERTDAIVEELAGESGRGELQVPYVPAARRFYLPQWVAFDDQGQLLVGSVAEAEAQVASMRNYLEVLHQASSLGPYIIADTEYRRKRYGILGQLVNQGRALAVYKTRQIIETVRQRAAAGTLNRGLSLTLPYFDDQELGMDETHFEVIPAGRIMFVPAFVVRAVHQEEAKVAQDTRYNSSTRRHVLNLLQMLNDAFARENS